MHQSLPDGILRLDALNVYELVHQESNEIAVGMSTHKGPSRVSLLHEAETINVTGPLQTLTLSSRLIHLSDLWSIVSGFDL